jgi:hypothetical protein
VRGRAIRARLLIGPFGCGDLRQQNHDPRRQRASCWLLCRRLLLEPVGKPLAGSRRPASPLAALSSVSAQNQCASLLRLASGARMRRSLIDDGFTNRLLPVEPLLLQSDHAQPGLRGRHQLRLAPDKRAGGERFEKALSTPDVAPSNR